MTITLRTTKGSQLTWDELDGNFTHLLNTSPVSASNTSLQDCLDAFPPGTTVRNGEIYIPSGTYTISSTILSANSLSNYTIRGAGRGATVLQTSGLAGSPVFKLINPRNVTIRDLSIVGESGSRPSYGIQCDVVSPVTGSSAPGSCTFRDIDIWYCDDGIAMTNDSGTFDNNNSENTIDNVFFETITNDGIAIRHSSSLDHAIANCVFSNCGRAAISNVPVTAGAGGSFTAYGNRSGGCAVILRLNWSTHALGASGWRSENDTKILATPTGFSTNATRVSLTDFDSINASFGSPAIQFDAGALSVLDLVSCNFSSIDLSFPTAGSTVSVFGGTWSTGTLTYANTVNMYGHTETAGAPTYTQSGSGILKISNRTGTTNNEVFRNVTSGTSFIATHGLNRPDCFTLSYAAPTTLTNITGGYDGQSILVVFDNANATVSSLAGGTGQISLISTSTFSAGRDIKLTYRASNGVWYG